VSPPVGPDVLVYAAHAAAWLLFAFGNRRARRLGTSNDGASAEAISASSASVRAPFARVLIVCHMVGFFVLFFGIERALFRTGVPSGFPGQRVLGAAMILAGGALMYAARMAFASWRFQAQVDPGHRLATSGPYRLIRHPIYAGMDLLALGTLVWIPTTIVASGCVLLVIAGDLRARAEERLLDEAFGPAYAAYRARTARLVPGLY